MRILCQKSILHEAEHCTEAGGGAFETGIYFPVPLYIRIDASL